MAQDARKLVDVLKGELEFLKEGGYRRASGSSWHPQFVFEDSGACLNQNLSIDRRPCLECVLMQLVPEDRREERAPCRHIRLSESGETLDSLYRTANREETETIVGKWLMAKINELENLETKKSRLSETRQPNPTGATSDGVVIPAEGRMICQCANPDCSATFDHRNGILLRFPKRTSDGQNPVNTHAVQHFWLCASCSQAFILEYRDDQGVVLSLRWERPPLAKQCRVIAAA